MHTYSVHKKKTVMQKFVSPYLETMKPFNYVAMADLSVSQATQMVKRCMLRCQINIYEFVMNVDFRLLQHTSFCNALLFHNSLQSILLFIHFWLSVFTFPLFELIVVLTVPMVLCNGLASIQCVFPTSCSWVRLCMNEWTNEWMLLILSINTILSFSILLHGQYFLLGSCKPYYS